MATMGRGKPKQLLLLSQDTTTMDTAITVDMDTMDTMERERLRLATIMATDMVMDMVDMVIIVIMERERLSPVIIIMAMYMVMVMAPVTDTMVKQQLFIDSSIFSIIDLDFLKSSQQKHTIVNNKQNSLFK